MKKLKYPLNKKVACPRCRGTGQVLYDECGGEGYCEYCKRRWDFYQRLKGVVGTDGKLLTESALGIKELP